MKKRFFFYPLVMLSIVVLTFSCSKSDPEPTADFKFEGNYHTAPATVEFQTLSIDADSHEWDFGDGNTSTEVNPTHTFEEPGRHSVQLKVTNAEGNTDVTSSTVTVYGDLIAWYARGLTMLEGAYQDNFPVDGGQTHYFYLYMTDAQGNQINYDEELGDGQVRTVGVNADYPKALWSIDSDLTFSITDGEFTFYIYNIDENADYYDPDTDELVLSKKVKITDIATEDNGPYPPEIGDDEAEKYIIKLEYIGEEE